MEADGTDDGTAGGVAERGPEGADFGGDVSGDRQDFDGRMGCDLAEGAVQRGALRALPSPNRTAISSSVMALMATMLA